MNDPYNMKNKLYAHLDTLNMIVKNKPWHSFCLEIHPTNYCTHNCTDCTSSPYRLHHPKQYLPAPELFKVLKRFSQLQGKSILWSGGGDPCSYKCKLTNKRFLDIAQYAASLALQQGLYTNGSCLNDELSDYILDKFEFIRISLDAFTETTYKSIRKTDDYLRVMKTLQHLIHLKKERGINTCIGISFVLRENNLNDLNCLKSWVTQYPVDYIYFRPVVNSEGSTLNEDLLENAYSRIHDAEKSTRSVKLITRLNKANGNLATPCHYHYFCPCLSADGNLYQCCHHIGNKKFLLAAPSGEALSILDTALDRRDKVYIDNTCPINCRAVAINNEITQLIACQQYTHKNFM